MITTPRVIKATALAAAIAAGHEGIKFTPYYDPPGILTACRGHTGPDVIKGKKYSLKECDEFFTNDMRHAIEAVERCQPGLPVPILASFADAVFNMGPTIACDRKNSTAARLLAAKNYDAACLQLPRWDKARVAGILVTLPGLTKRRNEEKELCLTWSQESSQASFLRWASYLPYKPSEFLRYASTSSMPRRNELRKTRNEPSLSSAL